MYSIEEIEKKKDSVNSKALNLKRELSLDLPDQYKEIFLSSPSFMIFNLAVDDIRKKDIPLYKEMIFSNKYFPLSLISPIDGKEIPINTLNLYEEYSHKGYYALTTPAIGMATLCHACLIFFDMLEKAVTLKHKIQFKNYIRELPIDILYGTCFEDQDKLLEKFEHIGGFVDSKVKGTSKELIYSEDELHIIVKYKEFNEQENYVIQETLQADFTSKSNNEALLFIHYHSGGTMHFSYPCLVSYYDNKWHLEEIQSKIPLN